MYHGMADVFSISITEIALRIFLHSLPTDLPDFITYFNSSNDCNRKCYFESFNSVMISFNYGRGRPSIFLDCESFLKSNSCVVRGKLGLINWL